MVPLRKVLFYRPKDETNLGWACEDSYVKYKVRVSYKGIVMEFMVADCGHGMEWAERRAIAHLAFKKGLWKMDESGVEVSARLKADGLEILFL